VRGPASNIEKAFRTTLRVYPHPTEPRQFYSPDIEPSVPAGVPIQDLSGLDNFSSPRPMDLRPKNSGTAGTLIITNATGSGPGGDFMGKDFRAAYAPGVTNDGSGQVVGLFEFGSYYTNDIYRYETNAGLPTSIVISNVLIDGVTGIPPGTNSDDGEQALDIDMVISMAPGATVLVYEGNNGNNIFNRMATDNLAKQMSCSFGYSPMPASTEQIFQQYAAQGQSMFIASGDGGAYPGSAGAISPQSEDPYLTIVGGTSLTTSGPGGRWISETAWGGSGGGVSARWGIPSWQSGISMQANQGSTAFRNIPDVSMLADTVIYWVFKNGSTGTVGGTSAAAPLWAGFTALMNQEAAARGQRPVGFLNPAVYNLGKGPAASYRAAFHDISTGSNQRYPAVSGYDLCTGWGSPTGSNTFNALIGTGTNDFSFYTSPGPQPVVAGGVAVTTLSVLPLNGFAGNVSFAVSGMPAGVTATLNPPTGMTSVLTLTTSNTAAPGTFNLTVTATSGGLAHSMALTLVVESPLPIQRAVNLAPSFNRTGMATDGTTFGSGADGVGFAYSATMLGSAPSWNGVLFGLGSPNNADLVSCAGQIVPLPAGNYTTLQVLGTAVNGSQASQVFSVTYTDNTTQTFTQSFSDWAGPKNFPGESVAIETPYRNSNNGTRDTGTAVNVYGYCFALNPSKAVKSLRLPSNQNVEILAIAVADAPAPVSLASAFNRAGIFADGTMFAATSGLDGGGYGYSAAWLGGAQQWNGCIFDFGSPNSSNAISCVGQTIPLQPGQFASIQMLATAVQGNQAAQSFLITYSDATTTVLTQNFSDWFTPQNYSRESKAFPMSYRNSSAGSKDNRLFSLYGYAMPLNGAKTVQSIRLPNNPNVEILAMTLVPAPPAITASMSLQNGQPMLNWSGGAPPYQVQISTDLSAGTWQALALSVSSNNLVITPSNSQAFYRIVSQ
ncbi:MAG TPA: S53 family peptidase, partial [Verrucomicrobiae bacterium]|nr:S53 family peptidase [Verrucomicrobiae bacterium]